MTKIKIKRALNGGRKKRAQKILAELIKLFPNSHIELNYGNNWELLVAVMLSAQCTDKTVNKVTEKLFKKYTTLDDYADADPRIFEKDIHSTGFYKNKTKNILATAKKLRNDFGGEVPQTMKDMLTLPGVARKTANIVLAHAYGVVEGIAVDTHVKRLAQKFGLTSHRNPDKIEKDLMSIFPAKEWSAVNHRFVLYGRYICPARKHDCTKHPLTKIYQKATTIWPRA